MKFKIWLLSFSFVSALFLAACSTNVTTKDDENGPEATNNMADTDKQVGDDEQNENAGNYEQSGLVVPEGLTESSNPKYPVGSKAIVHASHTDGMEGAEATIKAAYDTTVYSVSYTPTNGEEFEENHKWFVEGEITALGEEELDVGAEVIIDADHMDGMKGAQGTIDTVEETTVYVVDYTNSLGETVENHLWLKESELVSEVEDVK
ncbi:uncharacterized protein DUF1541 [Ureibacillus xyleni]|uniref:Uncharacterized protein DUF1541 n=1 Tax=Ureibacillus xyleni TaxID=614648 RepID=A0A285SSU4_9BACL|nr:YdhK family protein [Ureibacillus xyleni]SOC11567.1 uncharacterized protein DUF1541 [Ureibacillus xyleni]